MELCYQDCIGRSYQFCADEEGCHLRAGKRLGHQADPLGQGVEGWFDVFGYRHDIDAMSRCIYKMFFLLSFLN